MPLYAAASYLNNLSELPEGVRDALLNLIIVPPVLFSLVLSYLSGHVWAYVIFARTFPDVSGESAENRQTQYIRFVLDHNIGRVALGLLWLALWLVVLAVLPWLIGNRNLLITTDYITNRLSMIWILAMASQAALSAILLFIPSGRANGNGGQNNQNAKNSAKNDKSNDAKNSAKDNKTDGAKSQKSSGAKTKSDADAKTETDSSQKSDADTKTETDSNQNSDAEVTTETDESAAKDTDNAAAEESETEKTKTSKRTKITTTRKSAAKNTASGTGAVRNTASKTRAKIGGQVVAASKSNGGE